MNSRPYPNNDWYLVSIGDLERDISDRRKYINQLKLEIMAENRYVKSMEMDLENKKYELKMAQRKINKYDNSS